MTNEEMERGIEFLLKSQANFEARQASFEAQLAQTSRQIEVMAKTHTEFTRFVRDHIAAQSELNQSLRETVRALTLAQARTDERVSDLEGGSS
jgi:DICT domain-containing protein